MTAPQWIMIFLLVIEMITHNYRHNKIKPEEIGVNIVASMVRIGVITGILYWGGFWS